MSTFLQLFSLYATPSSVRAHFLKMCLRIWDGILSVTHHKSLMLNSYIELLIMILLFRLTRFIYQFVILQKYYFFRSWCLIFYYILYIGYNIERLNGHLRKYVVDRHHKIVRHHKSTTSLWRQSKTFACTYTYSHAKMKFF